MTRSLHNAVTEKRVPFRAAAIADARNLLSCGCLWGAVAVATGLLGCSAGDPNTNVGMPSGEPRAEDPLPTDDVTPMLINEPASVPIEDGSASITAGNSRIAFRGMQADGVEHTGGFREFSGKIDVGEDGKVTRISVEIPTESLQADNQKLTVNLKSVDFFNVKEHPTATFESTRIEPADAPDIFTITGNLTLIGSTQEISFDSLIANNDNRLTMVSRAFVLDKSRFGMDYDKDGLLHRVEMKVLVGIRHGTF